MYAKTYLIYILKMFCLFVCLDFMAYQHSNAKFIFIQKNCSISNNSVKPKYTIWLSKTFLFQAIQFSQTDQIQTIQFSMSIMTHS